MTATVIPLDSRRKPHARATCNGCACRRDGTECYPHRLDSLARRLSLLMAVNEDSLLIDVNTFADAVTDAVGVIHGITEECLPRGEVTSR